jgi:hypothetical protein
MKRINSIFRISLLLILMSGLIFSGCKKKSTTPDAPAAPTFQMSSTPDPLDNTKIYFIFKCTTNDVKLTKIVVTDPLATLNETYDCQGATFLQNQIYYFTTSYTKSAGTWSFVFTGNRTSDNSGFTATATLAVSGK